MVYYTYVLTNQNDVLYIGYCNNLTRRFKEHQHGEVYTTKRIGGPWKLIYYEACLNEFDAKKRERYLKSGRGRQFLVERMKNYWKKNKKFSP